MAEVKLHFQFKVNQATIVIDNDFDLNVRKRRERVVYKSSAGGEEIVLAYAISEKITPDGNLLLVDRSHLLRENNLRVAEAITLHSGIILHSDTDRILLTDRFTDEGISRPQTPLFFRHNLEEVVSGTHTVLDVNLLDESREEITNQDLLVDLEGAALYNNLSNTFNPNTGERQLFFVEYVVRNPSLGTTETHSEILNNIPVYRQALPEDITSGGVLDPGLPVYTLEDIGNRFEVRLSSSIYAALKQDSSALIKPRGPRATDNTDPWFCEVTNGKLYAPLFINEDDQATFKFEVAEFGAQAFVPYFPYKFRTETSARVNNHVIKIQKERIQLDAGTGMHIVVVLKNGKTGNIKRAFTTDETKWDTAYSGTIEYEEGIRSVDRRGGFVDLTEKIDVDDIIETSYYYEEDRYEIVEVDFNPITNQGILGKRYVFYIVPTIGGGRTKTLYYLEVDENGRILSTNQEDDSALLDAIAAGLYYDRPSSSLSDVNTLSFLDRFSHSTILDPASVAQAALYEDNPKYFVLGEVLLHEAHAAREVTLLDTRRAGGGLRDEDEVIRDAARRQPEVQWFPEVMPPEGISYPENGSLYVEVPCDLLDTAGGRFKPEDIREVVERHMALGVYPAIRAYAHDQIRITDFTLDNTNIRLGWPSSPGLRFNVRLAASENGTFRKLNDSAILNDPDGNTYTVSGLAYGENHWFYVAEVDDDGNECIQGAIGPLSENPGFIPRPQKLGIQTLPVLRDDDGDILVGPTAAEPIP